MQETRKTSAACFGWIAVVRVAGVLWRAMGTPAYYFRHRPPPPVRSEIPIAAGDLAGSAVEFFGFKLFCDSPLLCWILEVLNGRIFKFKAVGCLVNTPPMCNRFFVAWLKYDKTCL